MAWVLRCRCLNVTRFLTTGAAAFSPIHLHASSLHRFTRSVFRITTHGDAASNVIRCFSLYTRTEDDVGRNWWRSRLRLRWLSHSPKDDQVEFTEEHSIVRSISELRSDSYSSQTTKASSFKVVEVSADGTILELVRTPFDLRLQPRDVSLFTSNPRFSTQRATIAARDGSILFRTETCKAIITSERAVLFPLRRHRDTVRLVEGVTSRVMHPSAVPFEFRVLEAMLEATTVYFEKRAKRLRVLLESVINQINAQHHIDANVSEFQRLFPMRRALTEMLFDVKETREAIAEVVDNEKLLRAICLTEQQTVPSINTSGNSHITAKHPPSTVGTTGDDWLGITKQMKLASGLLDSYERQVETIEGVLKEMEDNMNDAREVWHMQMDSVRNRIIRINLTISIASFSLLLATLPASFFGMNLLNGLETSPGTFKTVAASCVGVSMISYLIFYGYYRYWPARRHQQRLADTKALKDILIHHIDSLDDLLSALQERTSISRPGFHQLVNENVQDPRMSDAEIDLLYRVFKGSREGLLEAGEKLMRS